ncbi:TniA-like transposition protein [Cupriavidus sp. GA3-3]|nr:TniA-like transposition protein [Cupriavidus sp. GA3-3]
MLGIHWATVYHLRRRFLADPVASALIPYDRGPKVGKPRLPATIEEIVNEVLTDWLPRQPHLAHPLFELDVEIRKRCAGASVSPPSRSTISRRWAAHRKEDALRLATQPGSEIPPGHLVARCPMDIVQIDHTLADLILVDDASRRPIGRPWLSIALDVSTRCVVGVYVGMDRPNAMVTFGALLSHPAHRLGSRTTVAIGFRHFGPRHCRSGFWRRGHGPGRTGLGVHGLIPVPSSSVAHARDAARNGASHLCHAHKEVRWVQLFNGAPLCSAPVGYGPEFGEEAGEGHCE